MRRCETQIEDATTPLCAAEVHLAHLTLGCCVSQMWVFAGRRVGGQRSSVGLRTRARAAPHPATTRGACGVPRLPLKRGEAEAAAAQRRVPLRGLQEAREPGERLYVEGAARGRSSRWAHTPTSSCRPPGGSADPLRGSTDPLGEHFEGSSYHELICLYV